MPTHKPIPDPTLCHNVELTKFRLELDELVTPIDKWTYFIKHAEALNFIPEDANEDAGLKAAFIEADKHSWTKEDLIAYDNASIAVQDERARVSYAVNMGVKEAIRNAVLGLDNNDVPISTIATSLNLTEKEVVSILEDWKNK